MMGCYARAGVLVLLFLGIVGCAVEHGQLYTKDGVTYGKVPGIWRGTWWQYYQRGLSYAEGGFWQEAVASFTAAVATTQGQQEAVAGGGRIFTALAAVLTTTQGQQDQRRINTYGVHVLDQYFPHRELGIAFYYLGRYDEAQRELEQSLRTVETARAKFFLNKVRTSLLQQAQHALSSPRLVLENSLDGLLINTVTLEVRGHAEAEAYIAALSINGRPQHLELAERRIAFAQQVDLQDGLNHLEIVATDLLGRHTHHWVSVSLDRQGPLVSVAQVEILRDSVPQRLRIQGFVVDQSPLRRFIMGGQQVVLPQGIEGDFHQEFVLPSALTALPFEVEDAAGNVTRGEVSIDAPGGGPQRTRQGNIAPAPMPRWVSRAAETILADMPRRFVAQEHACETERDLPKITLRSPDDQAVVYNNTVYLEIAVTGRHAISAFAVEGIPLLRRQGQQLFFAYIARLQLQRDNGFLLEAQDICGRRVQREIIVRHRLPKAQEPGVRLRVTLTALRQQEGCKVSSLTATLDAYLQSILEQQQRFRLQKSLAAAEGLIEGVMCVRETSHASTSLEVIAHFFDLEPSKADFPQLTEDVYGEDLTRPEEIRTLLAGLTLKLLRHFPLEQGNILAKEGPQVLTSLTSMQGVRPQMKLLVFRTAREQMLLGEARITDVSVGSSWATILAPGAPGTIQKNDQVIIK